jgi:hypothetical protein
MVDAVKELGTPSLHALWLAAKKKAEEEAKKLKQADKFAALEKKFKSDFGPDLDGWPKLYPDFKKLNTECSALLATLKTYKDAIKAAGLDDKVAKPMLTALDGIKAELPQRLAKAEMLIASDLKLAIADSKKVQRTPIIVFRQDIASQVTAAAGDAAKGLKAERVDLEVVLADKDLLEKVPNDLDDAALAREIREAANFQRVVKEIAVGLALAAKAVRQDPKALDAAHRKFEADIDKAIQDALERAAEPITRLTKVRTGYRNYKIKASVQIGLTAAGTASAAVMVGLAPLTFGAFSVIGLLGVARGGVALGAAIAKLGLEAENFANLVASDIATLGKQYKEASSGKVGAAELGKTLVNATMPTLITTIKSAKGNCDQLGSKIEGLVVATHDKAGVLGRMLTEQTKVQKAVSDLQKVKGDFPPPEAKKAQKLIDTVEVIDKAVQALIDKVETLNDRVTKTSTTHKKLAEKLAVIAAKEPTWAQVGEVVINAGAAAGFLVAANVGVPDPYAVAKLANDINGQFGNVVGALDGLKAGFEDLKGIIEERAKG